MRRVGGCGAQRVNTVPVLAGVALSELTGTTLGQKDSGQQKLERVLVTQDTQAFRSRGSFGCGDFSTENSMSYEKPWMAHETAIAQLKKEVVI
jgi:hypothetical protein